MFNFLRKIITVVIIFCSMEAIAVEFITGEIKRIYPDNRAKVFFMLKNDTCITENQYYYFEMNEEDARGKYAARNWYSMLHASAMAGKEVRVAIPECSPSGNVEIMYLYQDY